jgi:hypothetical protein
MKETNSLLAFSGPAEKLAASKQPVVTIRPPTSADSDAAMDLI